MKNENGFTLFEVLISMFIAGVAVLGLILLELTILRSSQSSFHYTVSTIKANNLVDQIWMDLCNVQTSSAVYSHTVSDWETQLGAHYSVLAGSPSSSAFATSTDVTISWQGDRFDLETANNQVTLYANYPDFSGGCQ